MKQLLAAALLGLGLLGCQHNQHEEDPAPSPAPTLVGEKWTLQTEEQEATPLDGSLAHVRTVIPVTRLITLTYVDEQHFALDVQLPSGASSYHLESTYSYQGQEVQFARMYSWAAGSVVPRTMRVAELSAHKLVLVEAWENSATHYFTTQTFSR